MTVDSPEMLLLLGLAVMTGILMGAALMASYAAKRFEGLVDPEELEPDPCERNKE